MNWLRRLFTRYDPPAMTPPVRSPRPDIDATVEAMRATRQIADDLNQGKIVSSQRFREIERKLGTGNIVEEALRGDLGRYTKRSV